MYFASNFRRWEREKHMHEADRRKSPETTAMHSLVPILNVLDRKAGPNKELFYLG